MSTGGKLFEKASQAASVEKPQLTPGVSAPEQMPSPLAPGGMATYGVLLQLAPQLVVTTTQEDVGELELTYGSGAHSRFVQYKSE